MAFESFDQAAEALAAEANAPETPTIPVVNTPEETPSQTEEQGTTPQTGSTDFDHTSLSPEEIKAGFLRRDDYTRKTQEIAPLRKFMETAGIQDVTQVQQAWEFAQRLQSDPVTTYQQLGQLMQQQGYLNQQATPTPAPAETSGEWDEIELPPHVQEKLSAVDVIQQRLAQFEQAQMEFALRQEMARQENMIRQLNPSYTEADLGFINNLGHATGGNLEDADALYQSVVQHILSNHIKSKEAIPAGAVAPGSQGHSITPVEKPKTLDDAHRAAKEILAQLGEL